MQIHYGEKANCSFQFWSANTFCPNSSSILQALDSDMSASAMTSGSSGYYFFYFFLTIFLHFFLFISTSSLVKQDLVKQDFLIRALPG